MQALTIGLTIFYAGWLCFVAFVLYRIMRAVQKAAESIYLLVALRKQIDADPV